MRSRREDERRAPRRPDEFGEDEDRLPVPARPARVALGLVLMVSGFLIAGLGEGSWLTGEGLVVLLFSPAVMLEWPED